MTGRLQNSAMIKIVIYTILVMMAIRILAFMDYTEMALHIQNAHKPTIFLLLGLQILTQLLITFQWHIITNIVLGTSNFMKVFNIFTRGSIIEAITPGVKIGGEAARIYYIQQDFDCTVDKALNIVVVQKSISMSVLLSIGVFSFVYASKLMSAYLPAMLHFLFLVLSLGLIIFLIAILFFSKQITKFFPNKYISSYTATVSNLHKSHWLILFGLSVIIWILFPIKMVILCRSFSVDLPFFNLLAITMISYMMGMLPLTPGGIGTFEGTMVALFKIVSVPAVVSLPITVIFRFVTFWFVNLASAVFVVIYAGIKRFKS